MRLDGIRLRSFSDAFPGEIDLDLRGLSGMCAVTGPNGAGKSTLLGCFVGAAHRVMPDGQRLTAYAQGRDSYVEAAYTNGESFTVRQTMNAVAGKAEAVVLDEQGQPLVSSGKVSEVKRWVAEHVPSLPVLYSSVFGRQDARGFVDLDPAQRIDVIMRALGHEELKEKSRAAGARASADRAALDICVARLADEKARGVVTAVEATAVVKGSGVELRVAREAVAVAEAELAKARAASEQARIAEVERESMLVKKRDLSKRIVDIDDTIASLEAKRQKNRGVLERRDAIQAASARVGAIDEMLAELRPEQDRCRDAVATAKATLARAEQTAAISAREHNRLLAEVARIDEDLARIIPRLEAAEVALPAAASHAERLEALVNELEAKLSAAERSQLHGKDRRIDGLRGGLQEVVSTGNSDLGADVLEADARLADELDSLPEQIRKLRGNRASARANLHAATVKLQNVNLMLANRERCEELRGRRRETQENVVAARKVAAMATADVHDAATALAVAEKESGVATDAIAPLVTERVKVAAEAAYEAVLVQAEARLQELDEQAAAMIADRQALQRERDAIAVPETAALVDVLTPERALGETRRALADAELNASRADDALCQAKASASAIAELEAERTQLEADLSDWRLLEADLKTVQLLELDAAGPRLTELVNDLLHNCLDARYSVRFETAVAKKSGRGEKEGCWAFVTSRETGEERDAKHFSGGQRSLIAEAINLGITMLACQHAGMKEPTLIRDETSGLDDVNGPAYIAMLRRAAEIVGSPLVLYITHDKSLQDMADHRIEVANGRVSVAT